MRKYDTSITYPNHLSDEVVEYICAREQRDVPYASKFAARSLARRFNATEDAVRDVIAYLQDANVIKVECTTVHLRTYRVNNK